MARQNLEKYPYHVELIELRANSPKDIRLYKKPSDMDRFPGSKLLGPAQNYADMKKYGITDRRVDINYPIDRSGPEISSAPFKGLERDKRNPYPDFIGNQTTFKYLLAPDRGPLLYLAQKGPANRSIYLRLVQLPKQEKCQAKISIPKKAKTKKKKTPEFVDEEMEEISTKSESGTVTAKSESETDTASSDEMSEKSDIETVESDSGNSNEENESVDSNQVDDDNSSSTILQTTGFVLERVLSTDFDAERKNRLYGLFAGKLEKFENLNEISITFTSELDGLQYSDERAARMSSEDFKFNANDYRSVVEVKSINTGLFYPRTSNDRQLHFYENNVLRKYWAQGRLTGLKSILCGVVEINRKCKNNPPTVKEIWNLNVTKIPEILHAALNTRENWKRAFPESILSPLESRKVAANAGLKFWDEITCFKEFHRALHAVKFKMTNTKPGDFTYFIYHNKKMVEISKIHNVELSRINSSVLMTVNHVRNQVIDTYHLRESIVTSLKGLASQDSGGIEFLKNWTVADIKLNRRSPNKSESNTVYLKLMFRSVRDAKKVLKSWTNPRRVKEHHIVVSWAAPACTLLAIFKRADKDK